MPKFEKPTNKRVKPITIEGYDELRGVFYRGGSSVYRLYDKLTPAMNLQQLAEFYETEKSKGNPIPANAELSWAVITTAANSGDKNLVQRIQQILRNNFVNTLTGINWYASGNAKVIHKKGTSDSYHKQGRLIGPDGLISEVKPKKLLGYLLGNENIEDINDISNKINSTRAYVWRLNSNPNSKVETLVGFCAFLGKLGLGCDRDPLYQDPAFRVLKIE